MEPTWNHGQRQQLRVRVFQGRSRGLAGVLEPLHIADFVIRFPDKHALLDRAEQVGERPFAQITQPGRCNGDSMTTSWKPEGAATAGYMFGMMRSRQPSSFGYVSTAGGVMYSWPGQNGQVSGELEVCAERTNS